METENPFIHGQALWDEHETFINHTARSLARSYFKVEEEDVLQEVSIFLWEKEEDLLAQGRSGAYVRTCIKNVARNYALRVRDTTLLETDTFYYSMDEVKELLPHFFSTYESWSAAPVPDGCVTSTRNDSVEIMCDLSIAYNKLNDSMKEILVRKYGEGEELSEAKDRQQASRAVKKLLLTLNAQTDKRAKEHEGPGNRKAITNAHGRFNVND